MHAVSAHVRVFRVWTREDRDGCSGTEYLFSIFANIFAYCAKCMLPFYWPVLYCAGGGGGGARCWAELSWSGGIPSPT